MKTRVLVDAVAGSGETPERLVLGFFYSDNIARIDIPVPPPLFAGEPQIDSFKRSLQEMLAALNKWEAECGQIEIKDSPARKREQAKRS
jgi:hypothetical protein